VREDFGRKKGRETAMEESQGPQHGNRWFRKRFRGRCRKENLDALVGGGVEKKNASYKNLMQKKENWEIFREPPNKKSKRRGGRECK